MSSIRHYIKKIKYLPEGLVRRDDLYLVAVLLLVGTGAFLLGRLSMTDNGHMPVSVEYVGIEAPREANSDARRPIMLSHDNYVASVNGSRYYAPWCGGAGRIKEENKVWFSSKADAEQAGYTPAKTCKGL